MQTLIRSQVWQFIDQFWSTSNDIYKNLTMCDVIISLSIISLRCIDFMQ
jgi:hypothetical protein